MHDLRPISIILGIIVLLQVSGCFGDIKKEVKSIRASKQVIKNTPMPPHLDNFEQELAKKESEQRKNVVLTLDIKKIFSDLEPNIDEFDQLFKSSVSTKGYLKYKKHLKAKIKVLAEKTKGKKYRESKVIYKMKVSKRRRKSKKEWVFGVDHADDLKKYYRSFKKPGRVEENKLLFTPVENDGKPVLVSEDDVTTVLKSEGRVVLYLYKLKIKKEEKVFIIDIPTFLDYAL